MLEDINISERIRGQTVNVYALNTDAINSELLANLEESAYIIENHQTFELYDENDELILEVPTSYFYKLDTTNIITEKKAIDIYYSTCSEEITGIELVYIYDDSIIQPAYKIENEEYIYLIKAME